MEVFKIKSIYLANALGFSSVGKTSLHVIQKRLEDAGFTVHEPFSACESLGREISKIEQDQGNLAAAREKMHEISMQIGQLNQDAMASVDLLVAILDGSGMDIDSGVAAEIGYAAAIGKKIFGLRTDFRSSGENPGVQVNLQVEFFITCTGGAIFGELDELVNGLPS
nr:nucleoside 2-deoxyribosyltransferase [Candidatus Sigynarchaeota archaeon]